jgi:hypothetical protein
MRQVRVALGQDYSDVPSVRGVYHGNSAGQTMKVELQVHPALETLPLHLMAVRNKEPATSIHLRLLQRGYAATMFESE